MSTLIVETNLTEKEKSVIAKHRKNFRERPEEYVSLSECMARNGVKREKLEKMPSFKVVYR